MKFKVKKIKLLGGLMAIIGVIVAEMFYLAIFTDTRERIIGSIIFFVFFGGITLVAGVWNIKEYFKNVQYMNKALKKY